LLFKELSGTRRGKEGNNYIRETLPSRLMTWKKGVSALEKGGSGGSPGTKFKKGKKERVFVSDDGLDQSYEKKGKDASVTGGGRIDLKRKRKEASKRKKRHIGT